MDNKLYNVSVTTVNYSENYDNVASINYVAEGNWVVLTGSNGAQVFVPRDGLVRIISAEMKEPEAVVEAEEENNVDA